MFLLFQDSMISQAIKDIDNFINKVQLPIIVKAASGGGWQGYESCYGL